MATEHNDQPPAASDEKKTDVFEIEDTGLEQVAGGSCAGCNSCGGGCSAGPPPDLNKG
jgi:hypothetical protein